MFQLVRLCNFQTKNPPDLLHSYNIREYTRRKEWMYERLRETWSLLSPVLFFFFVCFSSAIRGSTLTTMWAGHCANLQPGPPRRPSTSLLTCLPCPVRVQTTSSEWAVLKVSLCSECYLLCNKSNTVPAWISILLHCTYISLCYLNDTFCLPWLQNKQEIQLHRITIPTSGNLPGTIALCDSRLLLYITVLSQRNVHHGWREFVGGGGTHDKKLAGSQLKVYMWKRMLWMQGISDFVYLYYIKNLFLE